MTSVKVPLSSLVQGDEWVLVGPAAFKAVVRRAERLGCVRFAHVSAKTIAPPLGAAFFRCYAAHFPIRYLLAYIDGKQIMDYGQTCN